MLSLDQVKSKSASRIAALHPTVRLAAERLIELSHGAGVPIVISQGVRTISEQNELYAQGRTKPGQIVTNARGGYSFHNFGVAVDFALLMPDGKSVSWDMKRDGDSDRESDWQEVAKIGKALGFTWGGDFVSFKDYPHFEMTFGLTTSQYRAGYKPSQSAISAAMTKISKAEGLPKMTKADANKIIDTWLKPAYGTAKTASERSEIGRLADALREASGQPKQNG